MRCLVIDDEPIARLQLRMLLESRGPVDEAENAIAGLERVRAAVLAHAPYDLVCIDLSMPGHGGIDAIKMLKALDAELRAGARTNVVVVTASDDQRDLRAAMHQHVDGYLLKPVTPGQVADTIGPLEP